MTTHRPVVRLTLPPDLMDRVAALARTNGCTADTLVTAAVAATLFRYDRVEERRLSTGGTPSVVRVTDAARFTDLVAQIHSSAPALAPAPAPVSVTSAVPSAPSMPDGQDVVRVVLHSASEADEATTAEITAPEGQWTPAAVDALLRHAVAAPATRVGSLRLLSAEQAAARIAATNAAAAAPPAPHPLHRPFEEQAARHPDRVALFSADDTVTYGELDARAQRFADRLTALGAGPERPVALHLRRSAELVVAMLAVLKCGAPFVPLDDRMPPERIRTVLASARAHLLVSAPGTRTVDGADIPCVTEQPYDATATATATATAERTPNRDEERPLMELEAAIRTRRSQHRLIDPAPSDEEFVDLLGWAATAPDHGHLRPWRWILVRGDSRTALGAALASGAADAEAVRREARKPLRAPLLATLVLVPQRNHRVPDWEQLAASSAMVNSLMLLLHDRGFGSMWRTGPSVDSAGARLLLRLAPHERIIGWLYVGTPDPTRRTVPRTPVAVGHRVSRFTPPPETVPGRMHEARGLTSPVP